MPSQCQHRTGSRPEPLQVSPWLPAWIPAVHSPYCAWWMPVPPHRPHGVSTVIACGPRRPRHGCAGVSRQDVGMISVRETVPISVRGLARLRQLGVESVDFHCFLRLKRLNYQGSTRDVHPSIVCSADLSGSDHEKSMRYPLSTCRVGEVGLGPDGPKSSAVSFCSGLLLGIVWQHVRIVQYNAVKYEHFGRIEAHTVTGDSRKTLSAYRKAMPRFVANTQGCANRIVYQGSSPVYGYEVGQQREDLQARHVCTAYHFGRHRFYADQPEDLCARLCSEFQCDWPEIVNKGFAFNYTPFVIRTPRTCRDDDGHRKGEDLDYQPGTADEGGLSALFRVLVCSCCAMSIKPGSARKSTENRVKRRGRVSCQDGKCPSYERIGLSLSSLMARFI